MTIPSYSSAGAVASSIGICNAFGISPTCPSTVNAGDFLLFVAYCRADTSCSWDGPPSGFTLISNDSDTNCALLVAYKIADGSEDDATVSATGVYSGATPRARGRVYSFINADPTSPIGNQTSFTTGSGSPLVPSSLTTGTNNSLAVEVHGVRASTTITAPTGETGGNWSEPVEQSNVTNTTIGIFEADMATAGSISGGSATLGTSAKWISIAFELKEVQAAAGSLPPPRSPLAYMQHMIIR